MGYGSYERREFPLGRLDVRTPDKQADIGTVRATKNLCSLGLAGQPYYSPVETPQRKGDLDSILGLCTHTRQRRGLLSSEQLDAGWYVDGGGTSWEPDDFTTDARAWVAVVRVGRRLHFLGGFDGAVKTIHERYDPATGVYDTMAVLPRAVGAEGAFLHTDAFGKQRIYHMLGYDGSSYYLNGAVYDVDSDAWTDFTASKATLQRHGGWAYDGQGKYYVVSGSDGPTTSVYDIATDAWDESLAVLPATRRYSMGGYYGGKLYIFGGRDSSDVAPTDAWAYDPVDDSWTTLSSLPRLRAGGIALLVGAQFYLIGGEESLASSTPVLQVDRYDVATDSWTSSAIADLPTSASRNGGAVFQDGEILFTVGGESDFGSGTYRQVVEAYILNDGTAPPSFASSNALERLVALAEDKIYVLDPSEPDFPDNEVHTFAQSDQTRRFQCAPVGESLFMAVTAGEGYGSPEHLLELRDDSVRTMKVPDLPYVSAGVAVEASANGLDGGLYWWRYGYRLIDGTIIGAERAQILLVPVDANKYNVTFTVGEYREGALPALWTEIIKDIVIFITPGIVGGTAGGTDQDRWMRDPYYQITSVDTPAASARTWADLTTSIVGYPIYEEDTLTFHSILAGAAFAYNKRLLLGDVAFDFGLPQAWQNIGSIDRTDAPPTGVNQIRLGVTIETDTGTFERIGDPATLTTLNPIGLLGFAVMYPDRRATSMSAYISTDTGATWYKSATWSLRPAANNNVAFAFPSSFDGTANIGTMNDPAEVGAVHDHDVNRILVSRTFQPRALLAREIYASGNGPADLVVGFGANALPASEGQYGDFPVIIFNRESVMYARLATETSEVFFSEIAFVSNDRGCVGRYAFTNVDNVLAFAARDGIWLIRPTLDSVPISEPLTNNTTLDDLYACLSFDTALAYHDDKTRGRRELWVAAGTLVFTWAAAFDRWNILERARRCFAKLNNILYGAQKFVEGNTLGITEAEDGYLFHEHELF